MMTGGMTVLFCIQTDSTEDKAKQPNDKDVTLNSIRTFFSG